MSRLILPLTLLLVLLSSSASFGSTPLAISEANKLQISRTYGKLPLRFEKNEGQVDEQVRFLSRGAGYAMYLTPSEAVMVLSRTGGGNNKPDPRTSESFKNIPEDIKTESSVIRMKLIGSNPDPRISGLEKQITKSNYFIGKNRSKWRSGVTNFGRVKYKEVYPGIDLVFYGNQQKLEYDFIVKPGADPKVINFEFEGEESITVDWDGNLRLETPIGEIVEQAPVIYQEENRKRKSIEGRYVLTDNRISFKIDDYDSGLELVIDPVLEYSTYFGGSLEEAARGIAVDSAGDIYITGRTSSLDFPTSNPAFPIFEGGTYDTFVAKLRINASSTTLIYSTYLGGNDNDSGQGIVVGDMGRVSVVGSTSSADFPVTGDALQGTYGGGGVFAGDAFVARLASSGAALVYSSFLGGSDFDSGNGIALDSIGNIHVTGETRSTDFPVANAFQITHGGGFDAFVSKIIFSSGSPPSWGYSTYLGGSITDEGNAIAVDINNNAYITGSTSSTNFPTVNPIQGPPSPFNPNEDVFVSKLNPDGSALIYSTYLGGDNPPIGGINADWGMSIAVDDSGNAYVAGYTNSSDFPTTAGAFQTTYGGGPPFVGGDAFVTKINAQGNAWAYSTFLGGGGLDQADAIAVDSLGNVFITGIGGGSGFPYTANAIPGATGTIFVAKLNALGSNLDYSTPLGDLSVDGIALDNQNNVHVTGFTSSATFPVTANALQSSLSGGGDAFVSRLNIPSVPTVRNDFDGDGDSDLLLVHDNGTVIGVLIENSAYQSHGLLAQLDPAEGWTVNATGDLNGDGMADLLLYSPVSGEYRTILLDGVTVLSDTVLFPLDPSFGIEPRGLGDFDGDGDSEVILYQPSSGLTGVVHLNGGVSYSSFAWVVQIDEANNVTLKDTGDFNQDGKTDFLTYNTATGDIAIIQMDGFTPSTPVPVFTLSQAAGFTHEDTGDFNGDGKTDLLAIQASSGALIPLLMDGLVYQSAFVPGHMPAGFELVNAGIYDGDDKTDFLVYSDTSGEIVTFIQDGTTVTTVTTIFNLGPASGWTYHKGKP